MNEHPLRIYRRDHGITLSALAIAADTTAATVSRIEKGEFKPSFDLLRRLVHATGGRVSADEIVAHTEA